MWLCIGGIFKSNGRSIGWKSNRHFCRDVTAGTQKDPTEKLLGLLATTLHSKIKKPCIKKYYE